MQMAIEWGQALEPNLPSIAAQIGGDRRAWLVAIPWRAVAHESRTYWDNLFGNGHTRDEGTLWTIEWIWRWSHGSARLLSFVIDGQVLGL